MFLVSPGRADSRCFGGISVSNATSADQSSAYHPNAEPPLTRVPDRRRWPKRAGIAVLAVAALLAGVGISSSANHNGQALAAARSAEASLRSQVSTLEGQAGSLKDQLATAQAQARNAVAAATATANAKAASAYAARNAALSQQAATLKQQQATLAQQQQAVQAQMGELQASQISGDGVYVVGKDIKAGVYHTNGSGNMGANDCYFATLNSTNTSNIADNNNFDGPETVDVSSAYAFEVNGPCTWVRVG